MRILFFFLKLILFSGVLGILVYFFGGTLWLKVGTFGFLQDVTQLTLYGQNMAVYNRMCQEAPASSSDSIPVAFQLRFLDDHQYALEVVCTLIENSPLEIKRASLPPLISKLPGSAGFTFPVDQGQEIISAIRLRSINKELGVQLNGDMVTTGAQIQPIAGLNPKSACVSFGYSCCSEDSQSGVGDTLSLPVTDCPSHCFSACNNLPFVSLFNSDPPYDPDTREIPMASGSLDVIFNYGISPNTVKNVHIEYGDGQHQDSPLAEGIFTHTYACSGACRYTVALSASDATGVSSVETSQSKIYIVRK